MWIQREGRAAHNVGQVGGEVGRVPGEERRGACEGEGGGGRGGPLAILKLW